VPPKPKNSSLRFKHEQFGVKSEVKICLFSDQIGLICNEQLAAALGPFAFIAMPNHRELAKQLSKTRLHLMEIKYMLDLVKLDAEAITDHHRPQAAAKTLSDQYDHLLVSLETAAELVVSEFEIFKK